MISWQEFEDWYLDDQDNEKKDIKTMEIINGSMVLYEGDTISPTTKRVDPKVEFIMPINIPQLKCTCVFVMYDNQDALLHSMDDMR